MDIEAFITKILKDFDEIKSTTELYHNQSLKNLSEVFTNNTLSIDIFKEIHISINKILASGVLQVYHCMFWSEGANFESNCTEFTKNLKLYSNLGFDTFEISKDNSNLTQAEYYNLYQNFFNIAIEFNAYLQHAISVIPKGFNGFTSVHDLYTGFTKKDTEVKTLQKQLENAKKNALANNETKMIGKTHNLYSEAAKDYLKYAQRYDIAFYCLLSIILLTSTLTLLIISTPIKLITIKITILITGFTLGTLFLRKASHLRKLYHNYNHLALELNSLPSYLTNIEKTQHSQIYNDLMKNYYGNHIDHNQTDKSGDMINEQIKNSIELIKASTNIAIKAQNLEQKK